MGVTAEATAHQYPRPGVVYRPVRDAEPVAVRLVRWRDDPHPAPQPAIEVVGALCRGDDRARCHPVISRRRRPTPAGAP